MGEMGEGSGGEWGRELGMWYPPVHPLYMGCSYEFDWVNIILSFISRITPLCSLLHTLLKDKTYTCLQDE